MAGIMAALVFIGTSKLLVRLRIDDPLDAFAVHGANGLWGLLVCGIFATKAGVIYSGSDESGYDCSDTGGCPIVFAANLSFGLAVIAWTASTSLVIFGLLKLVGKLRVPESEELEGLDSSEHGAKAYYINSVEIPRKTIPSIPEGNDGSSDIESGEPAKLNALNSPTQLRRRRPRQSNLGPHVPSCDAPPPTPLFVGCKVATIGAIGNYATGPFSIAYLTSCIMHHASIIYLVL